MSIKNRIVFKGKLKDYPGAEALTEALSSTAMVTGNTITGNGHSRVEHGPGKGCYNM
jgi:hypothetical protein